MNKAIKPRISITPSGNAFNVSVNGDFEQLAALLITAAKHDKSFNLAVLAAAATLFPESKEVLKIRFKSIDNE